MKLLLVIISVLFLIGCKKEIPEARRTYLTGFQVFYSIGSGWTRWGYELNFDSTGYLQIHEQRETPEVMERNKECLLDIPEIDSLKTLLQDLSKIKLESYGFGPDAPTDYPVESLRYKYGDIADTCFIYAGNKKLPGELIRVLMFIDKLKNKYDPKPQIE